MYNCLYQVTPACSAGECYSNKNMTQHSLQNCRNPNALLHNSPWFTAQPNLNLPQGSLTFLCGPLLAVTTKSIPAFFLFASFYRGSTPVWFGGGGGGGRWAEDVTLFNNSPATWESHVPSARLTQCVLHSHLSKQWYGCQCFGLLKCTQLFKHMTDCTQGL